MFGSDKFRSWMQRPVLEKKNAKAPDYTPLANASKESAEIMAGLGRDQLAFAQQQYNDSLPLFQDIVGQQMRIGDETYRQANEDRQYNIDTYRPLEKGLVADAQNYNTDAKRNELAAQAAADAGRAFSNTQAASQRAMASMGVNPNSGRFASMQNQNNLGLAAMRANAMTGTRQQAENIGYARKLDAAGLGRNLTGASQGAYALSLNAGNAAGQNQMAPGQQYMQGMAQGASTIGSGRNMYQQGLTGVLNAQTSVYNTATNAQGEFLGSVLGAAGTLGAAAMTPSDRRLKKNIRLLGSRDDGINVYEFEYLWSDTKHVGVMADEVERVIPAAVMTMPNGYKAVNYAMLGD